jgi:hypothetical protein
MILKLEDIILKDMASVMKTIIRKSLVEQNEETLGDYHDPVVTDHSNIIDDLIPYMKAQNMTLTMFSEFIEKDDITRLEQLVVLDIFQILYPEEFYTLVLQASTTKEQNLTDIKNELNDAASKMYDAISKDVDLQNYEKEYIITKYIVNIIKEITPGRKEMNIELKNYFFDNIIYKLFPNRESYTAQAKEYYKFNFDDDPQPTTLIHKGSNVSGWVVYVFGLNTENSEEIINDVYEVVKTNNATLIATTKKYYDSGGLQKDNVGAIIHIPYDIVLNGTSKQFLDSLVSALDTYDPIGEIRAAKKYSNNLYYSYELKTSFNSLPQGGVPYDDFGKYMSYDETDYVSSVVQPDIFTTKGELYSYYSEKIKTVEDLKRFLSQEINKIDWVKMGYESNNFKENLLNLEKRIDNAKKIKIYLSIPKTGLEGFGINDFREFVKKLSV